MPRIRSSMRTHGRIADNTLSRNKMPPMKGGIVREHPLSAKPGQDRDAVHFQMFSSICPFNSG